MDSMNAAQAPACKDMNGTLPACAPLANPYVPYQQYDPQTYQAATGLIRGTLYPALDLPFMGMVNQKEKNRTALHQLQTMNFAISELGLYLDTHSDDQEAMDLFDQYVERYAEALQQYERQHGPTTQMGAALDESYEWIKDPWPWDYQANMEV